MLKDGLNAFESIFSSQEINNGRDCYCASLSFDSSGQELMGRVGNYIYEEARCGNMSLPSFPSFDPLLQALKNSGVSDRTKTYRVTTQQHERLYILQNYVQKWLDDPTFAERASQIVKDHNDEYNHDGGFLSERWGVIKHLVDYIE